MNTPFSILRLSEAEAEAFWRSEAGGRGGGQGSGRSLHPACSPVPVGSWESLSHVSGGEQGTGPSVLGWLG